MKYTQTHVYFWDGIFSNWHPAKFTDFRTHNTFISTEQAFMWYKAMYFNDKSTAQAILESKDPKEAKVLGRGVSNYDDVKWAAVRVKYMAYVLYLKFSQIPDYKQTLLETGDKILVEASPYDKIWGVGLRENDPLILDEKNWQGLNLLGVALGICREAIIELEKPVKLTSI